MIDRFMSGLRHQVDTEWFEVSEWDIFISAYNDSARISNVHSLVSASKKIWVFLEEYGYSDEEIVKNSNGHDHIIIRNSDHDESILTMQILNNAISGHDKESRICIDITGFMRTHIFSIYECLYSNGFTRVDFLYSEPCMYEKREETKFSDGGIISVRQVNGFQGIHEDDDYSELLIIGCGYDNELISRVINEKEHAKVVKVLPFPSLSADMYQESIIRLERCSMSDESRDGSIIFAPANDPFSVASELATYVRGATKDKPTNIYLSSLATKPQALGFAMFFIHELINAPASVIAPISTKYSRETSSGIGPIWRYKM